LLALKFPEIPLHNNPAELALIEGVVKRKISNGTRSDDGKAAWEICYLSWILAETWYKFV